MDIRPQKITQRKVLQWSLVGVEDARGKPGPFAASVRRGKEQVGRNFLLDVDVPTLIIGGVPKFFNIPTSSSVIGKFRNKNGGGDEILRKSGIPVECSGDSTIRRELHRIR